MGGTARSSGKLKVAYTVPAFFNECTGSYARFHDVVHTLRQMDDPPWEFMVVPLRRYHGPSSPQVMFRGGNRFRRFLDYAKNVADASRRVDILHIVQGDLVNSFPPLILAPSDKPLVAGPNVAVPHFAPLQRTGLSRDGIKAILFKLRLTRAWRNRLVFSAKSPLSYRYRVVLAFSDYHREWYVRSGIDPEKIEVLPTGVRTDIFNTTGSCISSPSASPFRILFIADLRTPRLKGVDLLLDGLKFLEDEGIPFEAWIVGGTADQIPGPLPVSTERIRFFGYKPRHELPEYYRACDVFVNPSRFESDGTTSVEARACGIPVIGSDLPTFTAKNHLTFRGEDGRDLGLKLKLMSERLPEFKQKALADASNWGIDAAIRKLLNIYETVSNKEAS